MNRAFQGDFLTFARLKGISHDSYSIAISLCYALFEELEYHKNSRKYLTINEYRLLKRYYPTLSLKTVESFARGEARMLAQVIDHIKCHPGNPRMLDAGCGLGSHAIFFGLLGASVLGVDLAEERLKIADKRLKYYFEKYSKKLDVRFSFKNILRVRENTKFDIVWSNQSVSHIHPVTDLLRMAYENLKNEGDLLICDSNSLNPYVAFRAMRVHHEGGLYTVVRDPETLKQIPYANERMLNPLILRSLLRQTGFDVGATRYSGFIPSTLSTRKYVAFIDETIAGIPFVRLIGAIYVVRGRKNCIVPLK